MRNDKLNISQVKMHVLRHSLLPFTSDPPFVPFRKRDLIKTGCEFIASRVICPRQFSSSATPYIDLSSSL